MLLVVDVDELNFVAHVHVHFGGIEPFDGSERRTRMRTEI